MRKSVVIDCLPESVSRYRQGWAVVAVDVIRATTTAITAAATGRRCFPAPDIGTALTLARSLTGALLAGESSGARPAGFEIDNSPAQVAGRADTHRPLVLVSSSGTKVIHEAASCEATYLACFRCHSSPGVVPGWTPRPRGRDRRRDQGRVSRGRPDLLRLDRRGPGSPRRTEPETPQTVAVIDRWRDASPEACLCSRSVDFLRRTGQLRDLDFILSHIDDLQAVFAVRDGEVTMTSHSHAATVRERAA